MSVKEYFAKPSAALNAVLLLSFVLVFPKKWEPGGNIDSIWYAAVARNIAETGNYFHFWISRYFENNIFDHLPLTYWITATLFKLFGVSDLVARLYPMVCSFLTYLGCILNLAYRIEVVICPL